MFNIDDTRLPPQFWDRVSPEPNTGCWLWTGHIQKRWGYGTFWADHQTLLAHRYCYSVFNGDIQNDRHLHHICHQPSCVNPLHLIEKSPQEHAAEHDAKATGIVAGLESREFLLGKGKGIVILPSGNYCVNVRIGSRKKWTKTYNTLDEAVKAREEKILEIRKSWENEQ
jgi:hypothetical protein